MTLPTRPGLYSRVFESDPARGFLSIRNGVALGAYLLFAVTFASFKVANDGLVYYDFLRRLLGERVPSGTGYAYQFGVAFFNLPFYLVARAVGAVTGVSTVLGAPLREASIGVASNVALGLTLYVGWKLLRRLDLPAGPGVLLLALFGSPLFYYTAFQPSYKHAVDALLVTLVAYLLLDVVEVPQPAPRTALALGASLAFLVTVRYANIGVLPGALVLPFVLRRDFGRLGKAALAFALVFLVLFAVPAARHIPFKRGHETALVRPVRAQPSTEPQLVAAGFFSRFSDPCPNERYYKVTFLQCLRNKFGIHFDTRAPVRMLVSVRRGLFLWTPLTALSVLGVALLFRSRPERRRYLAVLCFCAASLVCIHALWGDFWTNGFSFSQRFLAGLFPFYLLGTAELIRRFRLVAAAGLLLCALFSLFAGFNHFLGYKAISEQDGLGAVLTTKGDRDVAETLRLIGTRALERFGLR